jgi:hypothetical protein
MARRFLFHGLVLSALALGGLGCETHHSFFRPKDFGDAVTAKQDQDDPSKPTAIQSDASKVMSVDSDSKEQKPFFKSDRRSGGWSSEAREIERDLGVN